MKHFLANVVAMFFISRKTRHKIRNKIMGNNNEQIISLGNKIDAKQQELENIEKKYNYLKLKTEWLTHNQEQLLLPARFTEYDLVFAIGATCHVTTMLDWFGLRKFTTPLDWTGGTEPEYWWSKPDIYRNSRFHEKIQELCNNFENLTNTKYYKYVSRFLVPQEPHHYVVNTKLKIRYLHEFPANIDMAQHMPEFIKKIQRRRKHLYNAIDKSQKILIVWISGIWDQRAQLEQNVSSSDIKWAVKKLRKLYPNKEFDLVFFEPDGTKNLFEYEKQEIAPGAFRIKSNHFLYNPEYNFMHAFPDDKPHIHVISEMLDNIRLSKNAFSLENDID